MKFIRKIYEHIDVTFCKCSDQYPVSVSETFFKKAAVLNNIHNIFSVVRNQITATTKTNEIYGYKGFCS
jgi:hypothetical protein